MVTVTPLENEHVAPKGPVKEELGLQAPQIVVYASKTISWTPFDVKWIPGTPRFTVIGQNARGNGLLNVFELEKGGITLVKEAEFPRAIKCSTFGANLLGNSPALTCGDFEGYITRYDLEQVSKPLFSVKGHNSIINAIDGCGGTGLQTGPPEIASASRDGTVKIWDVRQPNKAVANISPKEGETARDAWAVALGNSYNDEERAVACGYDNGDIKLVDLRNMGLLWEGNIGNGVCAIEFDRRDIKMNKLIATALEGLVSVFDLRTLNKDEGFARTNLCMKDRTTVWLGKPLPQNRDLFMASAGNGTLHLYKYKYPQQRVMEDPETKEKRGVSGSLERLNSATVGEQPVSSFEWSKDKLGLCAWSGFDQKISVGIVTRLSQF